MATSDLIARDLKHVWHPCSQMKDFATTPPLSISHASGAFLFTEHGEPILDAVSSWWCKNLGHKHPQLKAALIEQAERYEHAILANTTNPQIVELSERLSQICAPLSHALYASDGSCAVDMALKMSVHAHQLRGQRRDLFATLVNSYHGETGLALSVSDIGLYREIYRDILQEPCVLNELPYCHSQRDPLWLDCDSHWASILAQLEAAKQQLAAIIIEPILQGAGQMRLYSPDLIRRIQQWAKQNDVYVIIDEILTGFGRLGAALACDIVEVRPDFICLGKGLTAGYLPLSVVMTHDEIFDLFYQDYEPGKMFLHSHTHSGNCLAVNVALATLDILESEQIYQTVNDNMQQMHDAMQAVAEKTGRLTAVRSFGWMAAADLTTSAPRGGFEVYQAALKHGALLRPLGNTLYWLPPLNITAAELQQLADITCAAINDCDALFNSA